MTGRWSRSAAEVAAVYGLLGFVYCAAYAATLPQSLAAPIAAVVPLRKDTFGAVCFVVSSLSFFLLQLDRGLLRPRLTAGRGPLTAGLRTIWVYALLVWAYLCVNSMTHPATIAQRLTHFSAFPAEGSTADFCFVLSAVALLALRLLGRARTSEVDRG